MDRGLSHLLSLAQGWFLQGLCCCTANCQNMFSLAWAEGSCAVLSVQTSALLPKMIVWLFFLHRLHAATEGITIKRGLLSESPAGGRRPIRRRWNLDQTNCFISEADNENHRVEKTRHADCERLFASWCLYLLLFTFLFAALVFLSNRDGYSSFFSRRSLSWRLSFSDHGPLNSGSVSESFLKHCCIISQTFIILP